MAFKNEIRNWEDLRLFLAVADAGGLTAAARHIAVSAPTLSRRMRQLETDLGTQLFDRADGAYLLTPDGHALRGYVTEMQSQSRSIEAWLAQRDQRPVVHIAAGAWTAAFMARHIADLTPNALDPRVALRSGSEMTDVLRREADIAIRNVAPQQPGLLRQRLGQVQFAIFGADHYCSANPAAHEVARYRHCDWVALSKSGATGSSSRWLQQRLERAPHISCDAPQVLLDAVQAGAGLCILPVFVGRMQAGLVQCSAAIDALEHTRWMVSHQDAQALPHLRKLKRRIIQLFQQDEPGRSGNAQP